MSGDPPPPEKGWLAFFGPERTDARCVKRIVALQGCGWRVLGFLFHRERGQPVPPPVWEHVDLGTTYNRRYLHRAWCVLRSFVRAWRLRHRLRECGAFYAVNPDNALLALFARWAAGRRVPLALEIADVQPVMTRSGLVPRLLRLMERAVLRRADFLITTSPGFVRHYFTPVQGYTGKVWMLENKVYPSRALLAGRRPRTRPVSGGQPWVIGYFGVYRCTRSLDIICRLAEWMGDRVKFILRGVPGGADVPAEGFAERFAAHPNIHYGGGYRYPEELPGLYAAVDLNWCLDFSAAGANSAWLLPNRIYEGGLFHTPAIAEAGTETARWIAERGTGWALEGGPSEAARALLDSLTPEKWETVRARCAALPDTDFTGETDCLALADRLSCPPG